MKDNRDRLEEVALDSVQRNGLKGLSFRSLADEIGIKSSSVHYYFPEKSDLARTLIERYSEEFFSMLADIDSKRWGLRRKLKAFIDIFEDVSKSDKLCLCGMMAAEVEQLDVKNRDLLNTYFVDTENWLTELFAEHESELNVSVTPKLMAKALLSGLEGALLLDRVSGNSQRLKAQRDIFMQLLPSN